MHDLMMSADFYKINLFKQFLQDCHQRVKHFGPRSGSEVLSGLIWVLTVCKGYEQTIKGTASGERVNVLAHSLCSISDMVQLDRNIIGWARKPEFKPTGFQSHSEQNLITSLLSYLLISMLY